MNERLKELAEQAGYKPLEPRAFADDLQDIFLKKFAELVRADEREACAKLCESYRDEWLTGLGRYEFMGEGADYLADFIRARSET